MNEREQRGLEGWHRAGPPSWFWENWMGAYDGSPEMRSRSFHEKKGLLKAQMLLVEAGREAQAILDSFEGEITTDVKASVLATLNVE